MSKLTSGLLRGRKPGPIDGQEAIEDINQVDDRTEDQIAYDNLDAALNSTDSVEPIVTPEGDPIIDAQRERIEKQRAENLSKDEFVSQVTGEGSEYEAFTSEEDKISRREKAKYEEFARLIDEGNEDAAYALVSEGNSEINRVAFDQAVASHKSLSPLMKEAADNVNFNFSSQGKQEFYDRLNNEGDAPLGDPRSMAEYGRRFLSLQEEAAREGLDQAFTDAGLYSFMHVLKEQQWREQQRQNDIKDGKPESEISEKEEMGTVAINNQVGGLAESAFNIKNGTAVTRGVTGALYKEMMLDVNDKLIEAGQPALFELKTIDKDGKKLNTISLTEAGMDLATSFEDITSVLIPDAVVKVRFERRLNKEGTKVKISKKEKKKRDKGLSYGNYEQAQHAITILENVGFGSNTPLFNKIEESFADPEARDLIDSNFIGLVGIEMRDGSISYRDNAGVPWRFTSVLNADGHPTLNTVEDMNDERFGFKYEVELSFSDTARYRYVDNTTKWIRDTEDKIFYYDFSIGNDRMYIMQNMGNYQTGKFARAMLESGRPYQIRLNNKEEVGMHKALILQRAGLEKDENKRSLYVEELIAKFDSLVVGWTEIFREHLESGKQGIPIKLLKEAEGDWEYLTVVEEALKFNAYEKNGAANVKPYETRFLTELDGTSNALAWSAVQSGNSLVARLTGLLPKIEGDAEDVYFYTVQTFADEMFKALASNYGGDEATRVKFKKLWEYLGVTNRSLAKKPLMIFVYGAGGYAIQLDFGVELDKLIADRGFQALAKELGLNHKDGEKFRDLSKKMMVKSIEINFPDLRAYSKSMAAVTQYALDQGLNPEIKTAAGHILHLGKLVGKAKTMFKASKKSTEGGIKRFAVDIIERVHNPRASSFNTKGQEIYKAVKMAGVSVTHSNDADNIVRGVINIFKELKSKGKLFVGAQIFDGFMTTTTQATVAAKHLNRSFKEVNAEISNLNRYINHMKEQAKKKGVEFDLSSQTVMLYNPKTGKEDLRINLLRLIERLNKEYASLQKKMANEEAHQFPIPRWKNRS